MAKCLYSSKEAHYQHNPESRVRTLEVAGVQSYSIHSDDRSCRESAEASVKPEFEEVR